MNFKQETIELLKNNNLTWQDVEFIQGNSFRVKDKETFLELMNFDYDNGFGVPIIPMDLKIVGKDWWLERFEYDGAENWEFKKMPKISMNIKDVKKLNKGCYDSLKMLAELK